MALIRVPDQQFIFVGGLHRSGTSMLAGMLARHPEASGLANPRISENEGQFLQTVYHRDSELGGAGRFAFDPRAQRAACTDPDQAAALRQDLLAGWNGHWDTSRRFLLEKSPGNCLNARFLESLFPGQCSFVLLTRHPIANALATRKWSRTSLFALMEHWLHAHELMRAQMPHLKRVAWVTYETLVAHPAETLAELRAFLGMAATDAPTTAPADQNPGYFRSWHDHYAGRIAPLPLDIVAGKVAVPSPATHVLWDIRARLRRKLLQAGADVLSTGREAGAIITHYESRVNALGYSLVDTSLRPPAPTLYAPGCLSSFAPIPPPHPVPDLEPPDGRTADAAANELLARAV